MTLFFLALSVYPCKVYKIHRKKKKDLCSVAFPVVTASRINTLFCAVMQLAFASWLAAILK